MKISLQKLTFYKVTMKKNIHLLYLLIVILGTTYRSNAQSPFFLNTDTKELVQIDSLLFFDNQFGLINNQNLYRSIDTYFTSAVMNGLVFTGNNTLFFAGNNGTLAKMNVPYKNASFFLNRSDLEREILPFPYPNHLLDIVYHDGKLMVSGSDGLISLSSDMGITWSKANTSTFQTIEKLIVSNNTAALLAIGNNGLILHSTDGGQNWTRSESGTDRDINDACLIGNGLGYAVGNNGTFLRTTDDGKTWESERNFGLTNDLYTIAIKDAFGFLGGEDGLLYTTYDNGNTWILDTTYDETVHAIVFGELTDHTIFSGFNVYRFPSNVSNLESYLRTTAIQLWQGFNNYSNTAVQVTSDWVTCSWGNFGMRDLGTEPRIPYNNSSSASSDIRNVTVTPWSTSYSVIKQSTHFLWLTEPYSYLPEISKLRFYAFLMKGIAYSRLALTFDKAEILDDNLGKVSYSSIFTENQANNTVQKVNKNRSLEDIESIKTSIPVSLSLETLKKRVEIQQISLQDYNILVNEALKWLDYALIESSIFMGDTDSFSTVSENIFNGFNTTYTYADLVKLVSTIKAQTLVYSARNPNENLAVNWDEVLQLTEVGIEQDITVSGDDNFWYSEAVALHNLIEWLRVDQKIVH